MASTSTGNNTEAKDSSNSYYGAGHKSSAMPMPTKLLFNAFLMQWQILVLPWQATVYCLTLLTGALISLTTFLGEPPPGYDYKHKLLESQKITEHLHQREDGFRRKIKDLQGRLETKESESRRLQKKLGEVKQELGHKPSMKRVESAQDSLDLGKNPEKPSKLLLHVLFWVCGVLPVYWILHQPTVPGLSRKFVWSLISPAALLYAFGLFGESPRIARPVISISSIFLAGFCFSNWLHTHC